MEEVETAKSLLEGKSCENCKRQKSEEMCVRWLGEACGWQWWNKAEEGVCDDWTNKSK